MVAQRPGREHTRDRDQRDGCTDEGEGVVFGRSRSGGEQRERQHDRGRDQRVGARQATQPGDDPERDVPGDASWFRRDGVPGDEHGEAERHRQRLAHQRHVVGDRERQQRDDRRADERDGPVPEDAPPEHTGRARR